MTEIPDPTPPPDPPPAPPPDDQDRRFDDQPPDTITSVTSITAAPDPAPAEAEGPGSDGPEVEVETTDAAAAHMIANPSPIPEYAMEQSVERPAATPAADPADPALTQQFLADAGLTAPFTPEPTHPLPPEPQYLSPEPPYPAAEPPHPAAPVPVPVPAYPEASVPPRRRPLFGTIIWGVLLLALAGYVLFRVLVPAPADPTLWLLGGVIVIGLLLIIVGVIAALRRSG